MSSLVPSGPLVEILHVREAWELMNSGGQRSLELWSLNTSTTMLHLGLLE